MVARAVLGWTLLLMACPSPPLAFAEDAPGGELLRYEPPPVDAVYPPAPGETVAVPAPGPPAAPAQPPGSELPSAAAPTAPPGAAPAEPASSTQAPAAPSPQAGAPAAPAEPADAAPFGARARTKRPATPGQRRIELASARNLPGAFGDPLRTLEALPGVTPIASGVPYVYIRGAPPAATGYVFDGIPLPQLFHGAFGPAVIHPRAMGDMRLYAGVPPAQYGRRAGGLVLAEGSTPTGVLGAELELRLIDVGAWVEAPIGKGTLTVSGRLGYPKLALLAAQSIGAVEPGTSFNYWDGQVRYTHPLGRSSRAELVWLGSFDSINLPGVSKVPRANATRLEFHRVEARLVHTTQRAEVGTALRFGYDNSQLGDALRVNAITVGPRLWSRIKLGRHTLQVGGDVFTSVGEVVDLDGPLASPQGDIEVSLPDIAAAAARNQGGVYVDTTLITSDRTRLMLGGRLDYWSVQTERNVAFDPRVRVVFDATPELELHAAFGTAHQPAVFLLPVPGLTDVALDRGLTRAIQSEAGVGYELPYNVRIEAQGFFHHYDGLLLPELVVDAAIGEDPPLVSAVAYGLELFLKRSVGEHVTGWISYTLGFAEADSGPQVIGKFRPDFDVRHVLNTVVQWNVWRGLQIGSRVQARSGRMIEQINPRYQQRLPWFVRADARIGYAWEGRWAHMLAYVEWLNMFVRREYLDADCFFGRCRAQSAPPISLPNVGIRAEL